MPDEDMIIVLMYLDMPRLTQWSSTPLVDRVANLIRTPIGRALRDKLNAEEKTPAGKQRHLERIQELDKPVWLRFADGEYR